ncbi:hypothetical protein WJX84_011065 [Apatococcus fuscideae]|uniref:Uncharacterized protein n=1 Tax=Apatococcus fuscideae TaxID=2026836 RepID=A0AAW1T808_9CHLO
MLAEGKPGRGHYHIVAPSLPAFSFSSAPQEPGFGIPKFSATCNALMLALGYNRYVAQDMPARAANPFSACQAVTGEEMSCLRWAVITRLTAKPYTQTSNCCPQTDKAGAPVPAIERQGSNPEPDVMGMIDVNGYNLTGQHNRKTEMTGMRAAAAQRELEGLTRTDWFLDKHRGYYSIWMTQPQTLGCGLNDSPTALAAWLVEKFRSYSDCNGNVETRFSKDELLTNISIYWFSGSITSSMRIYKESNMIEARHRMLTDNYCRGQVCEW